VTTEDDFASAFESRKSRLLERLEQFQRDQAERRRQSDERWQRLLAAVAEAGARHGEWLRENDLPWHRPIEPRPSRWPKTKP
jgi:hypothetical protein